MPLNLPNTSSSRPDDANTLKRRLLGAAVLIALAVIFLPLLLDGSGSESRFRRVEQLRTQPPRIIGTDGQLETPVAVKPPVIPKPAPVPKPPPKPVPSPAPPKVVQPQPQDNSEKVDAVLSEANESTKPAATLESAVAAVQQTRQPAAPEPARDTRAAADTASNEVTELTAWVVQAGSFSDEVNALVLRDRLREAGYPSFVSLADNGNVALYRVKVGPVTDKLKAQANQQKIENLLGRETLVRRYP